MKSKTSSVRTDSPRRRLGWRRRPDAVFFAVERMEQRLLLDAIAANSTSVSDFTVSGEFFNITKVTVDLNVTFPNDSFLSATLTSPEGTSVQLFQNPAGEENLGPTVFDDAASAKINQVAVPAFAGTFRPQNPLAAFIGQNPNGQWQLSITNNSSDVGTINSWSVNPQDQDPSNGNYVVPFGQTTPTVANGTDFGPTSTAVVREYTITNTSTGFMVEGNDTPQEVIVTPPANRAATTATTVVTGPNAADFVVNYPIFPLAAGATTNFEVGFRPSVAGLETAEIEVEIPDVIEIPPNGTKDAAQPLFEERIVEFAVQGTGLAQPNVSVQPVPPLDGATQQFIITNSGLATLQLTSLPTLGDFQVTSDDALASPPFDIYPPFSISADPSYADPIAPGGTTSFVVTFSQNNADQSLSIPASTTVFANFSADVIIASNDPQFPILDDGVFIAEDVTRTVQIIGRRQSSFFSATILPPPVPDLGANLLPGTATPTANLPFTVSESGAGELSNGQFIHLGDVAAGGGASATEIALVNTASGDPYTVSLTYSSSAGFNVTNLDEVIDPGQTAAFSITPSATSPQPIVGSISLTVTDTAAALSQVFTIPVDGEIFSSPIGFTSVGSTTFAVGYTNSFVVTATGSPTPTVTEVGDLPDGVHFDTATGVLSGTPASGASPFYDLTLTAGNNNAPAATQVFVLDLNQAPAFATGNTATFTSSVSGTFSIATTGDPTCTVTESGALPAGISFVSNSDGTALLAGTPAADIHGTYNLTITASNGVGMDAVQAFTLTVDQTPVITAGDSTTFTAGATGAFIFSATAFPTPSFAESGALPLGVSFVDNHNGTAQLAGTPAIAAGATYALTITAANGAASAASQSFLLTVVGPPTITSPAAASFATGVTGVFVLAGTGFPVPSYTEIGALPTGVTFADNGDGTAVLMGMPTKAGNYKLTLTATNSSSSVQQSFTLVVGKPKAPAITSANHATLLVGQTGSLAVTTTASPSATLSESGTLPAGVSFVMQGSGAATISGDPTATGVYHLTLLAHNAVGTATPQVFTLTAERAPAINSGASATFTVGTLAGVGISTIGGFPIATKITESGKLPSGVKLIIASNTTAALEGTPAAGKGGTYPILIIASNGVSPAATQQFMLTVYQPAAITTTKQPLFTAGQIGSFGLAATGYPAPTFTAITSLTGTGLTLVNNGNGTAILTGDPTLSGETYNLTISASNSLGSLSQTADKVFTLTVDQSPRFTSGTPVSATFATGTVGLVAIGTTGFPAVKITESGKLPSGVKLTAFANGTAELTGDPGPLTGGTYAIKLSAGNGIGSVATRGFVLTVDEPPAITHVGTNVFTIGKAGTLAIATTGYPAVTLSQTGAPAGLNLIRTAVNAAALAGTPLAGTAGNFTVTLTATNTAGTLAQPFVLTLHAAVAAKPSLASAAVPFSAVTPDEVEFFGGSVIRLDLDTPSFADDLLN